MSTSLHQMQARYNPQEDRIFLRINTKNRVEYRFWVTRRYLALLLPLLDQRLGRIVTTVASDNPVNQQAVMHFQQQSALEQTDFVTPYADTAIEYPFGEEGILLVRINSKPLAGGQFTLSLLPAEQAGEGITLTLDSQLTHALVKLLKDEAQRAEWMLMDEGQKKEVTQYRAALH